MRRKKTEMQQKVREDTMVAESRRHKSHENSRASATIAGSKGTKLQIVGKGIQRRNPRKGMAKASNHPRRDSMVHAATVARRATRKRTAGRNTESQEREQMLPSKSMKWRS